MDELKKIGATKYKNKQRYKDPSKIIRKPENKDSKQTDNIEDKIVIDADTKLFPKRKLASNWYRYDRKEEEPISHAKDFALIASAPILSESYFQFKSEKKLNEEVEKEPVLDKVFQLNMDTLSKCIATVPFYERCDIDKKYFTESQINDMKRAAKENEKLLAIHLEKMNNEKVKSETKQDDGDGIKVLENKAGKIAINNEGVIQQTGIQRESIEDDLDQWLDDILAD